MSDGSTGAVEGSPGIAPRARIYAGLDWLQARQRPVLFAAIAAQAVVLLAMIIQHAAPYVFGETIVLKVVPVDPRDMFRGDYVTLGYEISRLPDGAISRIPAVRNWWLRENRNDWMNDRTIYVSLERDKEGKHWHSTGVSVEKPSSGTYIRGKYSMRGWRRTPLQFGIEAYYVQEGRGKELEKLRNARQLSAEVAVAPWGQAKLIRLMEE